MCGITAFIGSNLDGFKLVYEGIKILQNRGYDSCGICGLNNQNKLLYNKYASTPEKSGVELIGEHAEKYNNCQTSIVHCRWCTHGSINDTNAHPHLDNKKEIALVHNGIIENFQELKDFLEEKGYHFKSETDTEVIVILIEYFVDTGCIIDDAINKAISKLEGTWGLAIISRLAPNKLYLCKNGSPLLIGYDKKFALVASESSAILNHVKSYFVIEDNEIITLSLDNDRVTISHKSKIINDPDKYFKMKITEDEIDQHYFNNGLGDKLFATTPDPYQHWMLKEIIEQPKSLQRTLNMGGRLLNDYQVHLGGLEKNREDLLKIKHLLILACGTSYHAALLGAKYFKLLRSHNSIQSVQVLDASEFSEKDIPFPYSDVGILVLSQSGETKDVHRAMKIAEESGIIIFSIVNVVGSLIAREASCGIYLNAGREVAVASTKSFTSQVLTLALIAIWYAESDESTKQKRATFIKSIRKLSGDVENVLFNIDENLTPVAPVIKLLSNHNSIFILGKDLGEPIAYEGALKIKEIAYLHAEGYPGGSLKHGPFALIEKGTPVILIILDDQYAAKMETAAMEVKARGATTIVITTRELDKNKHFDHVISLPKNKIFGSLLAVIPLQYLSYILALHFGHNPDYPKNLAKVLSVD